MHVSHNPSLSDVVFCPLRFFYVLVDIPISAKKILRHVLVEGSEYVVRSVVRAKV